MNKIGNNPIDRRGVLVIHPGAIGDVLLARPVLHLLRRRYPSHEIALLAGQAVGRLLRDCREIDRMFPIESMYLTELFAGNRYVHPPFRDWLPTCDYAVGWLQDQERVVAETLRTLGVQQVRVKSPAAHDLLSEHQAARYLEVVEGRVINVVDHRPLVLSATLGEMGRQILQPFNWSDRQRIALVHPGSGSTKKCLDPPRLASVIEWLHREGIISLLLEGPADHELVTQVSASVTVAIPIIRGLDLSTAAAVLSHAGLYVGHDSGMTHLAAALSIPTLACFGPTNPRRWAPLGSRLSILTGALCGCPTWDDVERCQERTCLHITPERIIKACRILLMKQASAPIA